MSRFVISSLREGPDELRRKLPLGGETIEIRTGPDGQAYFSARLDEQVIHRLNPDVNAAALSAEHLGADDSGPFLWVRDIVMRPSRPGDTPHYGMQRFPVDIAYVLDLSYHDDQVVDFTKLQPVAAVDIDDLPNDDETTAPDDHLTVPPPLVAAEGLDVERTVPVQLAGRDDQLTVPPPVAIGEDLDAAPAEPEDFAEEAASPGADSGLDIDVEQTTPIGTAGHGDQLAAPAPVFPAEDLDAAPAEPEDFAEEAASPGADSGLDIDVEQTTPVETAGHGDQLAAPAPVFPAEDLDAAPAEREDFADEAASPGHDSGLDIDVLPSAETTAEDLDAAPAEREDFAEEAASPGADSGLDIDVEQTTPVETAGHDDQLAAPAPVFPAEDLDAAPAERDDLAEEAPSPGADSGLDIDLEQTTPVKLEHGAEDRPFGSDIAVRSDRSPVAPASAEPEYQEPPQPGPFMPIAAEPVANGHVEPLVPTPSPTGARREVMPAATAPSDGETTGPLPTVATARPSGASVAKAGIVAIAQRRPLGAPPAPPAPSMPFGPRPAAPPARPSRLGGPPVQTSAWPEGARTPHSAPAGQTVPPWNGGPPPVIPINSGRSTPSAKALAVGAAVLTGLILIVIAVWTVAGSSDSDQTITTTSAQAKPDAEALKRLNAALPKGYSESSCSPDEAAADATVTCGPNTDPGGPVKATYTLYPDKRALTGAFTETIGKFEQVTCPGNIQSPGPWRRNAAPDTVAGTLFCGIQAGQAVVVWTSDAQLLLNVVESGAQDPSSLDQLYAWWGTHS